MSETRPRVLIVDDDARNRDFMSLALGSGGYEVQVARDGEEGLELALSWHPDVVWMDVLMPGTNGLEATRRLRIGEDVHTQVIICTARPDVVDEAMAMAAGADEVVLLPLTMHVVLARTERAMARRRAPGGGH